MGIPTIPKKRTIAVNASNGAGYVLISSTIFAGYVEIQEMPPSTYTGTFTAQGLTYTLPDDNYVTVYVLTPGTILQLGDQILHNRSIGTVKITFPDGSSRTTTYLKVQSATTSATQVEVREWPQNATR